MNNLKKYIGLCGLALLPVAMQAQTIGFETQDYKAIGVYDTWEQSPFRTGELQGNVAVVDNHLIDGDANTSSKILGVQRSRFGSNTFGVRIDLNETFELTPSVKYAHVMIHKPNDGRVMLIGLGKKTNRTDQTTDVEQFWVYPMNDIKSGEWFDAVFPIKGNGGIDIYSLVVVPDCEAPHTLASDFVAYVDDIVINNDMKPRVGLGNYPVNFASDSGWGRDDRKINAVKLSGGADGEQTITITDDMRKGYMSLVDHQFKAKAGNTVTPSFVYEGTWMNGYVYLDKGNDGDFSYGVNSSDVLDTSTDLVSFSWYRQAETGTGKNSTGASVSNSNVLNPPSFTIPSNLPPGLYRLRYKVDWNNIDPGGSVSANNSILSNGGGVVDVLLNVHEDQVSVTQDNRNGEVLIASTGVTINNDRIPFGQDFKIKMNPSNGFDYNGIRVRHGYNLAGDSLIKDNPQFRDDYFYIDEFAADGTFTIPGSYIDGDVLIEGLFVEQGTGVQRRKVTYNITLDGEVISTQQFNVMPGSAYPEASVASEASIDYFSLTGFPEGSVPNEDVVVNLVLTQNLPFQTATSIGDDTVWYKLMLTESKKPLVHASSSTYIDLNTGGTGSNAQWAFIGDVINGFKIVNRGAGEGYVLSSSTAITDSNDGTVYAIMTAEPVPSTHNTYWIPTKSTYLTGEGGFYLHQLGFVNNRLNSRDNRLAYWVGGADGGSTFTIVEVDDSEPEIDYCTPTPVSGRSVSGGQTKRTDRYVTSIALSDGTTTVTVAGGGKTSPRDVYADRTSTVLNTEPGKTISMTITGKGDWCNTYVYIDTDLNGFDNGDQVFSNWDTKSNGNHVVDPVSFTLPADIPSGKYRVRYISNWSEPETPCVFGDSGSDNGEAVIDFYIKVTKPNTINYVIEGDGSVEGWSSLNATTGRPTSAARQFTDGATISSGDGSSIGLIIIPGSKADGTKREITAVTITNGEDETFTLDANADRFKAVTANGETDKYAGAIYFVLSPISGDVNVSAQFEDDTQGIDSIFGDENDGPVEFYNLNGVKIEAENLAPGVYIVRRGDKTAKVYIK